MTIEVRPSSVVQAALAAMNSRDAHNLIVGRLAARDITNGYPLVASPLVVEHAHAARADQLESDQLMREYRALVA